jgi:Tfp pilus assembly protein PilO
VSAPDLRKVDAAGLAAALALTAAAYFGGLEPIITAMRTRAELLIKIERERHSGAELAAKGGDLRRELSRLDSEIQTLAVKLSPQSAQNERLARMMSVATDSNLRVEQLQPGAVDWEQRYGKVPVLLRANGSFAGMTAFLARLAEFPDVGVRSLHLAAPGGSGADARASEPAMVVELVWYVMPREQGR